MSKLLYIFFGKLIVSFEERMEPLGRLMMSFEEKMEEVQKKAVEFDEIRKRARSKMTIFLLGAGFPDGELQSRIEIAGELKRRNLNVVVMEELPQWKSITIGDKFRDILDKFCPDLFVTMFTKRGVPYGVTFEVGYLCGHYGRDVIKEKLRICIEHDVDERRVLTAYIREMVPKAGFYYDPDDIVDNIISLAESRAVELGYIP